MTWEYRVTKEQVVGETLYSIREIYHRDGRTGWTQDEVAPTGETLEELRVDLEMMQAALLKPVFDLGTDPPF